MRVPLIAAALVFSSGVSYQAGRHIGLPTANVATADATIQARSQAQAPELTPAPANGTVTQNVVVQTTPAPTATPLAPKAPLVQPPVSAAKVAINPTSQRILAPGGYSNSYYIGQCTYYVASRRSIPPRWGNANAWYDSAMRAGWAVGSTPAVGAIAWTGAGSFGHLALVEKVEGRQIYISEMNYNGSWNRVTYRWADAASFEYIY